MNSIPPYRNPHNDPPKVGEIIHYMSSDGEHAGIVSRSEGRDRDADQVWIAIFMGMSAKSHLMSYDDYDPTSDPDVYTWHFDHMS